MNDQLKKPQALDFFAGSGLATEGLRRYFRVIWANDNCPKKAAVYSANHPTEAFRLDGIENVRGRDVPAALLSWASFPCQDLSLAGKMGGIDKARSGLVWHWLRVMDEMPSRPPLVVAENVMGLVSAHKGAHYRLLHRALVDRGYRVGAVALDAAHWLPQSRPRVFVVGVLDGDISPTLTTNGPTWAHPDAITRATDGAELWVWWKLPLPPKREVSLREVVDFAADRDAPEQSRRNLRLIPPDHRRTMERLAREGQRVFPGYKRTRARGQVLELRFDDIAGCLRTPEGGSSRQFLVFSENGHSATRLLTVREAASLMGAPASYKIPGTYNAGYKAMGDAVAVPAVQFLARHLLSPLAKQLGQNEAKKCRR